MTADEAAPSLWARRLGFGGLIPFVGLAAALWVAQPGDRPLASLALLGYGATIASFLGALHWGFAMRERDCAPVTSLLWGVVPSLLGWAALLLGQASGLLLMAALLWACFAVDRVLYPRYRLRAWLPMRLRLTLVASISCLVGAAALDKEFGAIAELRWAKIVATSKTGLRDATQAHLAARAREERSRWPAARTPEL